MIQVSPSFYVGTVFYFHHRHPCCVFIRVSKLQKISSSYEHGSKLKIDEGAFRLGERWGRTPSLLISNPLVHELSNFKRKSSIAMTVALSLKGS